MREDEIRLRVGGEVTIELLSGALAEFTRALDAVEASHGASVRWVVAGLDHGSATAVVRAVPADARSDALISRMCMSVVEAGQAVMRGEADVALPVTRHMTKLQAFASGDRPVAIECTSGAVEFISGEAATRADAEMDRFVSLGTIRGRVEIVDESPGTSYRSARGVLQMREPAEELVRRMRDAQ